MSKAYDRVELNYLKIMLERFGFSQRWIELVVGCFSSVRYQILYGNRVVGPIVPTRGIRQGDPLPPYLFLICAEGFSALIRKYERHKLITGCWVARGAPSVSHMFFADDSYLFVSATVKEAENVQEILSRFEMASGQSINYNKSSVFFSKNTIVDERDQICSVLNVGEADDTTTYLGLPNIIGRNKGVVLGFLKNKMTNRVHSWDGRLLSRGGRNVLIRNVLQSIPNYAMSVFLLPMGMCQDLEQLMAKFYWKSAKGTGISWMCWDKMARSKEVGG